MFRPQRRPGGGLSGRPFRCRPGGLSGPGTASTQSNRWVAITALSEPAGPARPSKSVAKPPLDRPNVRQYAAATVRRRYEKYSRIVAAGTPSEMLTEHSKGARRRCPFARAGSFTSTFFTPGEASNFQSTRGRRPADHVVLRAVLLLVVLAGRRLAERGQPVPRIADFASGVPARRRGCTRKPRLGP